MSSSTALTFTITVNVGRAVSEDELSALGDKLVEAAEELTTDDDPPVELTVVSSTSAGVVYGPGPGDQGEAQPPPTGEHS